jgi:poly(A) polymerase
MSNHVRLEADWLHTAEIRAVFSAFAGAGFDVRVVGGAVRNTLMGRPVADIDLATVALPEQTIALAKQSGLRVVPTGLKHGTVSILSGEKSFEVTTLRRDVETSGRHAIVAFTDDWAADASRRDFTINALYCDASGLLYDPLGGYPDIQARTVRFIGHAEERIREDYLRILRFFRFTAEYCAEAPDATGLRACAVARDGLKLLSAERVKGEFLRILVAERAFDIIEVMFEHGFVVEILGLAPAPRHLAQRISLERILNLPADPVGRLGCLAVGTAEDALSLSRRLKVSNEERRVLLDTGLWREISPGLSGPDVRRRMYDSGADRIKQRVLTAWARADGGVMERTWETLWAEVSLWVVPRLPVHGRDVIDAGVPSGEQVGKILAAVEGWWLEHDFEPDRVTALRYLADVAAKNQS